MHNRKCMRLHLPHEKIIIAQSAPMPRFAQVWCCPEAGPASMVPTIASRKRRPEGAPGEATPPWGRHGHGRPELQLMTDLRSSRPHWLRHFSFAVGGFQDTQEFYHSRRECLADSHPQILSATQLHHLRCKTLSTAKHRRRAHVPTTPAGKL